MDPTNAVRFAVNCLVIMWVVNNGIEECLILEHFSYNLIFIFLLPVFKYHHIKYAEF